jgi:hypothetical protein
MRDQPRARGIRPFLTAAASLVACSAWVCLPALYARDLERVDAPKAGYLFNFLKFVEWPPFVPADMLTLCLLGESRVYARRADLRISSNLLQLASAVEREG